MTVKQTLPTPPAGTSEQHSLRDIFNQYFAGYSSTCLPGSRFPSLGLLIPSCRVVEPSIELATLPPQVPLPPPKVRSRSSFKPTANQPSELWGGAA